MFRDQKREFHLAAWEYYGLANMVTLDEETKIHLLKCAMTCAILTPAGDNKDRLLSVLHKDERCKRNDV
jgi:hypothetical protein